MKLNFGPDGRVTGLDAQTGDAGATAQVKMEQTADAIVRMAEAVKSLLVALVYATETPSEAMTVIGELATIVSRAERYSAEAVLAGLRKALTDPRIPESVCASAMKAAVLEAQQIKAMTVAMTSQIRRHGGG